MSGGSRSTGRRPAPLRLLGLVAGVGVGLYVLYFQGLDRVGLLGPDEPRYASIGRAMAATGDWVTPRLWGQPWFEKPALLYWMVGAGYRLGLGPEWAPRLPVALVSVLFLGLYFAVLRREFGARVGALATGFLATSAGWLAYSQVAVADLPMSAAFAASMMLSLGWVRGGSPRPLVVSGGLLGLAVLAKGLVPVALAAPLWWMGRRRLQHWLLPLMVMLAVAAPWYWMCFARNGEDFIQDFFWRHHFGRYASAALLHQQPFWFYLPVLLAGLFPWTPLAAAACRPGLYRDTGGRFLLLWVGFGMAFFSLAENKLPGYLLPLLPAVCALLGLAADRKQAWLWGLSAALIGLVPAIGAILPAALASGLRRAPLGSAPLWGLAACLPLAAITWWLARRERPLAALAVALCGVAAGVLLLKQDTLPRLDERTSARSLWRAVAPAAAETCVESLHRSLRYGLNYYSLDPLPDCAESPRPLRIRQAPGASPEVAR